MTGITTQQLLTITPIDETIKNKALEKLPTMNADEKFRLEQICWKTLMNICKVRTQTRFEEEIQKTAKEGRTDKIDMAAIEDQVLNELLQQIVNVETETQIEEVKKMLRENIAQNQTPPPAITPDKSQV